MGLVACRRNPKTCAWEATNVDPRANSLYVPALVDYDIWMVNGDPLLRDYNKFEHQFSFEDVNLLETHLVFLTLYLLLATCVQLKIRCCDPLPFLLCAHLWLSVFWLALVSLHYAIFSVNGVGIQLLTSVGLLISRWADSTLLVLILATAEHWFSDPFGALRALLSKSCFPFRESRTVKYFGGLFGAIFLVQTFLTVFAIMDQDPVRDVLIWNTLAGMLLLGVRFCVILWFLAIVRHRQLGHARLMGPRAESPQFHKFTLEERTLLKERIQTTADNMDFVHFTSGTLLWLLSLPLIVFLAEISVSSLYRKKMIAIVTLCSDFTAVSVYSYMLISLRSIVLDSPTTAT
ncbi:hypothetical protein Ciccas_007920 [Cichlidogyrus casuarinus]|uniref:GPR180/TMEM145 transmembrane domain-containing protein n=1 Tax=Cichlidogyrus casuarinus TaxID=1844966 RepID=A0ABD2Q5K3_9PLAT